MCYLKCALEIYENQQNSNVSLLTILSRVINTAKRHLDDKHLRFQHYYLIDRPQLLNARCRVVNRLLFLAPPSPSPFVHMLLS